METVIGAFHSDRAELIRRFKEIYQSLPNPSEENSRENMKISFYHRWSLIKLVKYILSHPEMKFRDSTFEFMKQMSQFADICKTAPNMFVCAYNVANGVWIHLINEEFGPQRFLQK